MGPRIFQRLPPLALVGKATVVILVALAPIVLAASLFGRPFGQAVYLGMIFMTVAFGRRLPVGELAGLGLAAGAASGVGVLVAGHTALLLVAVAAACAMQWVFNRRSAGVGALLPYNVVLYSGIDPGHPLQVATATWLGAAVVIALAALVRARAPPDLRPAERAAQHALELAAGCIALVLLVDALDLPRGNWAILTLCLVFVPSAGETRVRVGPRALGTAVGAVVAVAVAALAPPAVCLALAALTAILTVTYALLPDDLLYTIFLTATVLLGFSAGGAGATLEVAVQRVEMTALGAAIAVALTLVSAWPLRRRQTHALS